MSVKYIDLRVMKTRNALVTALYDLLSRKSLDEITVTELCEKAVIRKATFYKHFGDKTELLVYMIRELQEKAKDEKQVIYNEDEPHQYYIDVFKYLFDFVVSNEMFVRSILKSNASYIVVGLLTEEIEYDIRMQLKKENDLQLRDASAFLAAAYSGAIINCTKWWILQDIRPNKDEMIRIVSSRIMRL